MWFSFTGASDNWDGAYSFIEKGDITHTVSNAHLMIPIDFLHLEDQLRNFCTQLDQVHDSIIKRPDNIGTKLAALKLGRMSEARCDRLIQEFESVKDIWQPYEIIQPERSRPKRVAAAAAIGIGVVAAVSMFSQIYSHVQLSNLISETNQQMDKHIHRLNGAVKINAQNIDALNQTFHMYHGQTLDEFLKLQDIQALSTLSIALSTLETDMANIVKGLVSLSQHRLSPSLVSPAAIHRPNRETRPTCSPTAQCPHFSPR